MEQGWGEGRDLRVTEEEGALPGADPSRIPAELLEYGRKQLGSLGSGNHFVELQVVEEVFAQEAAEVFRLFPRQVAVMIHSGSRRMGNGTALHYVKEVCRPAPKKYGIDPPHPDLACVPLAFPGGGKLRGRWPPVPITPGPTGKQWRKKPGKSCGRSLAAVLPVGLFMMWP